MTDQQYRRLADWCRKRKRTADKWAAARQDRGDEWMWRARGRSEAYLTVLQYLRMTKQMQGRKP